MHESDPPYCERCQPGSAWFPANHDESHRDSLHPARSNGASISRVASSTCAGISGRSLNCLGMLGGRQTCATPENEQVRKRIPAQPVCAMESGSCLPCCKKSGHGRFRGFRIDANTSHHVVAGRSDLHRPLRNVHIREFLELVIHAGQLSSSHSRPASARYRDMRRRVRYHGLPALPCRSRVRPRRG